MSNELLFFIFGIATAISAVTFSVLGLKLENFPGKAFPVIIVWFSILVVGSGTFAVLHAKDEDHEKAAKYEEAGKEIEKAESSGPFENEGEGEGESESEGAAEGGESENEAPISGPGGTLELAASPTELAFDTTELTSKPGKVTIDFDNPAPIEHNVVIELEGEEIARTELIAEGETSVEAELGPGTYTFLCTVPGHAEAGMEGTLVVK